ncbi:MAG: methionine adenosyltransferase, partial [Acidimicrobiia bacterium]
MGHPDKVADQISDAILDATLSKDPWARVACEALITRGLIVIAGEITSHAEIDLSRVAIDTIREIGYDDISKGFDADRAEVVVAVNEQSPDIAIGVDAEEGREMGAGDQGMMFGFACGDTDTLMPLPIHLAHRLVSTQAAVRRAEAIPHLGPDAKSQVTVAYEGVTPKRVDSVLLSTQHGPEWTERHDRLQSEVVEHILRPALGAWWSDEISVHVNPTGRFEIGGPAADTGLTGRKIIVDTYGGWLRHGGGALSGKDPSKVDRSGAYAARYIAKNIVTADLAERCELRLSYAIGVPEPTSVSIDCRGTARIDEELLEKLVLEQFDLTPHGIIDMLDLARPIYRPTSYHGHFGRIPGEAGEGTFSWERVDRAEALRT